MGACGSAAVALLLLLLLQQQLLDSQDVLNKAMAASPAAPAALWAQGSALLVALGAGPVAIQAHSGTCQLVTVSNSSLCP